LLRLRHRARRCWSVQALLDERRDLLAALDALERARATVATTLRQRALEKPAARDVIDDKSHRHKPRLSCTPSGCATDDDGMLNAHGVRPWEDTLSQRLPDWTKTSSPAYDGRLGGRRDRATSCRSVRPLEVVAIVLDLLAAAQLIWLAMRRPPLLSGPCLIAELPRTASLDATDIQNSCALLRVRQR
jgi:hypothetical protein